MNGEPVVLTRDEDHIRIITLNRPKVRNALDMALRAEVIAAVEAAEADESVRVLVLTGAGGAFCAGGDINTMNAMTEPEAVERAELTQQVVRTLWSGSKPVVAAVEGPAFGAGLSLALACDRVVAAADARFGAAFTRIGLAGDMGITATLAERLGPARARQFLMFAEQVRAPGALTMGLIDVVTEPGNAVAAALADAQQLAAGPPIALAAIKGIFRDYPLGRERALQREAEGMLTIYPSADFAEGVAAFREKRPPVFRGR
jgi:enoyl-CoA hydratase/carnithine racemase